MRGRRDGLTQRRQGRKGGLVSEAVPWRAWRSWREVRAEWFGKEDLTFPKKRVKLGFEMVKLLRIDLNYMIAELTRIKAMHGNLRFDGWDRVKLIEKRDARDPKKLKEKYLEVGD
jgi:hypothetical protein